jgi:hypothetical protein
LQSNGFVGSLMKGRWAHQIRTSYIWLFVDKLVYELFNQPLVGQSVLHIDYDRQNDYVGNLDKKTKNEVISYYNKERWKRKKNRGVAKHNDPKSKKKWRSILTFNSTRQEVKYFKTRKEAQADFIRRWEQKYGEKYVATY